MSTRSFIAKQIGKDAYLTVYCHSDGYLTYNGALLLGCYNTPEQVDELLKLGDLSYLAESLHPNPDYPHSFDYGERQQGVTVAYGRDRGDKDVAARKMTMAQLDDPNNWTAYVYISLRRKTSGSISRRDIPVKDCAMLRRTWRLHTAHTGSDGRMAITA